MTRWTLTLLLVVPVSLATTLDTTFDSPAQWKGRVEADGQWALLVFYNGTGEAWLDVEAGQTTNRSTAYVDVNADPFFQGAPGQMIPPRRQTVDAVVRQGLLLGPDWSSLYVWTHDLNVSLSGQGHLTAVAAGRPLDDGFPAGFDAGFAYRVRGHDSPQPVLGWIAENRTPAAVTLTAKGVLEAEWSNAEPRCQGPPCLDGAGTQNTGPGRGVGSRIHSYLQVTTDAGQVQATGDAVAVLVGGGDLGLIVNGSVRLPLADVPAACHECETVAGRTVLVRGDLELQDVRVPMQDRMQARLGGELQAARVDETPLDPSRLFPTTPLVVGMAVVALAWKLFGLLRHADPLKNARRQTIYDAIVAKPGATYRELMKATGYGDGTVRHHLGRLEEAGLIVARQGRNKKMMYFENHGRYDRKWRRVAARKDSHLCLVHDWLEMHPGSDLKSLVTAFSGWPRSSIRSRLQRLENWGLVERGKGGRYWIVED